MKQDSTGMILIILTVILIGITIAGTWLLVSVMVWTAPPEVQPRIENRLQTMGRTILIISIPIVQAIIYWLMIYWFWRYHKREVEKRDKRIELNEKLMLGITEYTREMMEQIREQKYHDIYEGLLNKLTDILNQLHTSDNLLWGGGLQKQGNIRRKALLSLITRKEAREDGPMNLPEMREHWAKKSLKKEESKENNEGTP